VICYRFAAYATPLRTVPASKPGRFHRGDEEAPTQYLSLHPLGPLAELMRGADLRSEEQVRELRMRTWALDVPFDEVPEIGFASANGYGIAPDELVSDDRDACQRLAARLRTELPGAIVPSAALPGTRNAVLFGARVAAPYLTEPVSSLDIPASITVDGARPPFSLLPLVRFVGAPHAAFEAWRAGAGFAFREPDWSI
jgi:hypothetical protein